MGYRKRISVKRIHSVSYRWIKPWILSLGNVLLIPPMGRMDKQNTIGEDKRCTSQKMVKLRKYQGKRMRETKIS